MKQKKNIIKKEFNPWKRATIVLAILVLIFAIESAYSIIQEQRRLLDLVSPEVLRSKVVGTPSWADYRGNILGSGVQPFNDSFYATNQLINESIYFIYATGCYYCQVQIEYFGEEWERYVESGLTVDCSEVEK